VSKGFEAAPQGVHTQGALSQALIVQQLIDAVESELASKRSKKIRDDAERSCYTYL
jgi:hypothetical protein